MPTSAVASPAVNLAIGLPQVELISLVPRADAFDDPAWVFEPKYDGLRAVLYGWGQGCEIEVLEDIVVLEDLEGPVQDLGHRVAEVLGGREAILDGEVVSLDRRGKPALPLLLRGEGYLAFAASDLLWLNGADLRDRPLEERKQRLTELLPDDTGPLYKILAIEEHGRALFGAIKKLDLGGIVAKSQHDPYHPSTVWYEIRNPGRSSPSEGWGRSSGSEPATGTPSPKGDSPALTGVPMLT